MELRGAIVISTYSRAALFEKCIKSIYGASKNENYQKIIIVQKGNLEILKTVRQYIDQKTTIVNIDGKNKSALENICFNYFLALNLAFEVYQCDWVLEIEDDTVISDDTFIFIENIVNKYLNNKKFRGINLGSTNKEVEFNNSYSLLRNSFHASQGVLTRQSWKKIKSRRIRKKIGKFPLDWCIENYWKTGFVVTPNISRCMNYGWVDGTHVSRDPEQDLFIRLMGSWEAYKPQLDFKLKNIEHFWNGNVPEYESREDLKYFIKYVISFFTQNSLFIELYKRLRNLKRFLLNRPSI